jgi:hypothetical protein
MGGLPDEEVLLRDAPELPFAELVGVLLLAEVVVDEGGRGDGAVELETPALVALLLILASGLLTTLLGCPRLSSAGAPPQADNRIVVSTKGKLIFNGCLICEYIN